MVTTANVETGNTAWRTGAKLDGLIENLPYGSPAQRAFGLGRDA